MADGLMMEHRVTILPCSITDAKGKVVDPFALQVSCTCGWYNFDQEFWATMEALTDHLGAERYQATGELLKEQVLKDRDP